MNPWNAPHSSFWWQKLTDKSAEIFLDWTYDQRIFWPKVEPKLCRLKRVSILFYGERPADLSRVIFEMALGLIGPSHIGSCVRSVWPNHNRNLWALCLYALTDWLCISNRWSFWSYSLWKNNDTTSGIKVRYPEFNSHMLWICASAREKILLA